MIILLKVIKNHSRAIWNEKGTLNFFQSLKTVDSFTLIALLIFWKPAFCIFYFLINCFRPNTANFIFENYSMSKVQNDFLKRKKEYDYCTQIWGKTNFIAIEKIMSLSLIFYYCFLYQRAFIMIWSTQEILYTRKKLGVNSWFLFADISLRVLRVVADVWTNCLLRYSAH